MNPAFESTCAKPFASSARHRALFDFDRAVGDGRRGVDEDGWQAEKAAERSAAPGR